MKGKKSMKLNESFKKVAKLKPKISANGDELWSKMDKQ